MNLVAAAALGLGLGVITGMPLGVINVAIVDAASARHTRYAMGLGVGGALADSVHALLAFIGVGRLVTLHPAWMRGLALVAAVAILGYAIVAWRRRHHRRDVAGGSPGRGVVAGLVLTLPNPGALAAWVAVAAALWPDAITGEAITLAAGVGVGSAVWFALLARWVARVRPDHAALRYLPRIALVVLAAIAISGVIRVWT